MNDDAGRMIGQRIIPMESIQSGYRFISLRNEFNLPIGQSSSVDPGDVASLQLLLLLLSLCLLECFTRQTH